MINPVARWLCIASFIFMSGCAAQQQALKIGSPATASATAPIAPNLTDHAGITGVWEGTSIADCMGVEISDMGRCEATQNITLTMFQEGSKVSGYYRCAYGTQNCRNLAMTGVIKNGNMEGRRLMMRVMLEDGSMCYFTGIPAGDRLDGRYSCMTTGMFEQGRFRTQRSY